ncbi:MAG TPA: TetR family transcriptional regulator [Stackebrandtia sp.]|uniref:TetR/AcrR family transcriptional regulator n=1 Tax=Stackebrandtia sp. TaxID=2023065 RepID=UPI002D5ADFDD|nr:TetR family transcriptional regulator [Stackebrandtia sp.]HZE38810.1 TetR family transcriptional regulator [Stackebrandtia sp.]
MTEPIGRRERKKAATRQALADAALRLTMERGYDQVSVKDIAEEADVAVTTLFKHFPSKESLLFDRDADIEAELVSAVRDRPEGMSILQSLRAHIARSAPPSFDKRMEFMNLVEETKTLREHFHRMWMRHETAVAEAIAEEVGAPADDVTCAALAHFALESRVLMRRFGPTAEVMDQIFALLEDGWSRAHPGA